MDVQSFLNSDNPLMLILDEENNAVAADFLSLPQNIETIILTASEQTTSTELTQLAFQYQEKNAVILINHAQRFSLAALATITHLTRQQTRNATTTPRWLLAGTPSLLTLMQSLQNKEIPYISRERAPITATASVVSIQTATLKRFQSHWIKTISLVGLLLVGLLLWHHKTQDVYSVIEQPPITRQPEKLVAITPPPAAIPTTTVVNAPATPAVVKPIAIAAPASPALNRKEIQKKIVPASPTYILQLMASHDRASLQQFIHRYHLEKNTSIIVTHAHGKSWYAIAYGKFASEKQAEQARQHLSAVLKNLHPWVKKL